MGYEPTEKHRAYHRQYKATWLENPENRDRANAQTRARYASIRRFLDAVKTTAGCIDCGYDEHPAALEFDHRPGEEKTRLVSHARSLRAAVKELVKCDVRCSNCHRIITYERDQYPHPRLR